MINSLFLQVGELFCINLEEVYAPTSFYKTFLSYVDSWAVCSHVGPTQSI